MALLNDPDANFNKNLERLASKRTALPKKLQINDIPGIKPNPITGLVNLEVICRRFPEQNRKLQEAGSTSIFDFMRSYFRIDKESLIELRPEGVLISKGKHIFEIKPMQPTIVEKKDVSN